MHLVLLLIIGIIIPLVTPLLFHLYVEYMPGYMIGTSDGWLGYLGGYSGGFLAFISAYVLFYKERTLREQCWINIETMESTIEKIEEVDFSFIYSRQKTIDRFDYKKRKVLGWGSYPVIIIQLENISSLPAKDVAFSLKQGLLEKNIRPFVHRKGRNNIAKFESEATLKANAQLSFILHIDPQWTVFGDEHTFIISSQSLTNRTLNREIKICISDSAVYLKQ
jgi:hypothetical protein